MTRELNILTVISIASLTGIITKYPTIGAKITEQKEKPKLPRMDFIFNRRSLASRVEPSVLSEALASSPRLASRGWIIFDDLRPSCPSILLRGTWHKVVITFGGIFPAYLHRCTIDDHLRWSSSCLRLRKAPVMTWHPFHIGIRGLCSHLVFLGDSAPEATFSDEKSLTTEIITHIFYR